MKDVHLFNFESKMQSDCCTHKHSKAGFGEDVGDLSWWSPANYLTKSGRSCQWKLQFALLKQFQFSNHHNWCFQRCFKHSKLKFLRVWKFFDLKTSSTTFQCPWNTSYHLHFTSKAYRMFKQWTIVLPINEFPYLNQMSRNITF